MFRTLQSRFHQWVHKRATKAHARKRLADLKRRLVAHDQDVLDMGGRFSERVMERMAKHRAFLVEQIELAKKNAA